MLVVVIVIIAVGYLVSLRIHPLRKCPRCNMSGRHFGAVFVFCDERVWCYSTNPFSTRFRSRGRRSRLVMDYHRKQHGHYCRFAIVGSAAGRSAWDSDHGNLYRIDFCDDDHREHHQRRLQRGRNL